MKTVSALFWLHTELTEDFDFYETFAVFIKKIT